MGIRKRLASLRWMQKASLKVFSNCEIKDEDGNEVAFRERGRKYLLYSKKTGRKVGWIRTPKKEGGIGAGWCNPLAYLMMPKVSDRQLLVWQLRSILSQD